MRRSVGFGEGRFTDLRSRKRAASHSANRHVLVRSGTIQRETFGADFWNYRCGTLSGVVMSVRIFRDRPAVVMEGVSWEYYSRTLEELGPSRNRRITFDDDVMEIVVCSHLHERTKSTIRWLINVLSFEADVPMTGDGTLTLRRKDLRVGLEPDECYYVQTPAPPASAEEFDLMKSPLPDLAVEVGISAGWMQKRPIYAKLGMKELWWFDVRKIVPLVLGNDGEYHERGSSLALPTLSIEVFNRFLIQAQETSQHQAARAYAEHLRSKSNQCR